ncbi:hypothetical protein ACIPLC_01735 [Kitasatospora sp. NPDC086801]|uniref:hypothetical protein n=1 Tax=Kitasatospora sp. NPDC086801 TaxID=3364066 RepID=UPI003805AD58
MIDHNRPQSGYFDGHPPRDAYLPAHRSYAGPAEEPDDAVPAQQSADDLPAPAVEDVSE